MLSVEELERLRALFQPEAVAVIGASSTMDKLGYNLVDSLVYGGFPGRILPIHPNGGEILGLKVYPSLEDAGIVPDLVVIGLNQFATVEMVERCGRLGVKGVICIAGGYREMGQEGEELESRLVAAANRYGMKMVGPNTLGLVNTYHDFNATFYPFRLNRGNISLISQSGGVGLEIVLRAQDEGLGISKWIGLGNAGNLGFAELLQYLAQDDSTKVIALFLEGTPEARRFVEVAGQVAQRKPIVVLKVGDSQTTRYAALTHTGSMTGSYQMWRDILEQFGLVVVESTQELVALCKAFVLAATPKGAGVGILTHTAGPSILALDELARRECLVPPLAPATLEKAREVLGENPPVVLKNPLDAAGGAYLPERYGLLVRAILEDPGVDLLITIYCLHKNWHFPSAEIVEAKRLYGKPIVACYISTLGAVREDREQLQGAGIPVYTSPREAAWAAAALVQRFQQENILERSHNAEQGS